MTRDEYVSSLKSAFVSTATRLVQAQLGAALPWTLSPWAKPIVEYILNHIFEGLATEVEMAVFFAFIDARGIRQGKEFGEAANDLRLANQTGDQGKIDAAEKRLKEKLRALVVFTN